MAEEHPAESLHRLPCSVDSSDVQGVTVQRRSLLDVPRSSAASAFPVEPPDMQRLSSKSEQSESSAHPKVSRVYTFRAERDRAIKSVQETARAVAQVVVARKTTMFTNEVACEIERTLYDLDYYTNAKGELKDDGIVEFRGSPSPGLLRAFTDSRVRYVDFVLICSVCATCVLTPLTFIFKSTWKDPSLVPGNRVTLIFDLLLDIFYAFYLVWELNVSILDNKKHCEVVSRTEVIRRRIHSGIYWIQWLSVTPYLWIACGVNMQINCMKLVRLHHIFNMPDSLWQFKEGILFRVGRIIGLLLFVSHWSACLLVSIGGYREVSEEQGFSFFETQFEGSTIPGSISLYIMAFVEAIYMLTGSMDNPLGDGLAREKQFGSLIIVAVCSPVGCVVMSLFIASICREQNLWGVLDMKHEENKAFMNRALQSLNIPHQLRQRVFKLHHFQRMGHDREAFEALFSRKNLSPALESALKMYIYHDNVMQSPYFCGKDTNYVLEVIRVLDDQVFLPGDFVTRRGEVGTQMYFIVRGEVSVLVPNPQRGRITVSSSMVVKQLGTGQYFGEVALITNSVRTAWVRADGYVLVAALAREDVQKIWVHFPAECDALVDMAANTKKRDQERINASRLNRDSRESFGSIDFAKSEVSEADADYKFQVTAAGSLLEEDFAIIQQQSELSMGSEESTAVYTESVAMEAGHDVGHANTETPSPKSPKEQLWEGYQMRSKSESDRPYMREDEGDWRQSLAHKAILRDTSRAGDEEKPMQGLPSGLSRRMSSEEYSAQAMRLKLGELSYGQGTLTQSQCQLQQQVADCIDRISSMEQALMMRPTYKSSKMPARASTNSPRTLGKSCGFQGGPQAVPSASYVPIPRFA